MTELLLVRHGESTWNAARRWQGRSDAPLSELGEAQARRAGESLAPHGPFDAVVTSSLRRARATGELIAEASGLTLGPSITDLVERSAGEWEGLRRDEIEAGYPGFLERNQRPGGYEDDAALVERVVRAIDALGAAHPSGRLLVVTHGGVIHALERHTDVATSTWQRLDNLEGRWFAPAGDGWSARGARVHLLATEPPPAPDDAYV